MPLPGCVTLGKALNLLCYQFPQGVFEVPLEGTRWGDGAGCPGGDWILILGTLSMWTGAQGRRDQPAAALVCQLILERRAGLTC